MRFRAILLIAILIGGTYAMIQAHNEYKEKRFAELLHSLNAPIHSLTFNEPLHTWKTEDEVAVEDLLNLLQNNPIQKLKPEEVPDLFETIQATLHIQTVYGDEITILVEENLIRLDSSQYYKFVNGPLDSIWITQFFIPN